MVFQQSRVKDYNFDEWKAERSARNKTKRVRTVRKRELFYCNRNMYEETQAIQRTEKTSEILRREAIPDGRREEVSQQKVERPIAKSSSEQEHKVNALASGADEGRDKLR